jgi:acetyl-CoA C-acetyltransferase
MCQQSMNEAVIVSACRTAIGGYLGALQSFTAPELGGFALAEAVRRAGVEASEVDECIMGNVIQAGVGQNPARQAVLKGGLPTSINAFTINKVCGSGLKAVMLAAQAVKCGDADFVLAGGMESMSNAPHLMKNLRGGVRMGNFQAIDAMIHDGLWCAVNNVHMGTLAEYTAEKAGLSRNDLDAFSADSQQKAAKAIAAGAFAKEIVPISIPQKKGDPIAFATDEAVKGNTTVESLGKLRPAFQKDGIVTAGNAPGLTDGAAALMVTSRALAEKRGLPILGIIREYATSHREAKDLFFAPIDAVRLALAKGGRKISDIDYFEANEAFASQCLADGNELGWDWSRVNVNGGAIALGHPIGASGARVLVTLLNVLEQRGGRLGLATLCLGGGGAVALVVERP